MIDDIAEIIDELKRDIMPKVHESIRAMKTEYPDDWQRRRRIDYLIGRMQDVVYRTLISLHNYEVAVRQGDNMETRLFLGEQALGGIKTIVKLQNEVYFLRRPDKKDGKRVTEQDIERAREYPFRQLVEIDRNRMARCPFHEDKDPSMHLFPDNHVYCFSCGRGWDTIAFVQEREGLSFPEAVQRLQ